MIVHGFERSPTTNSKMSMPLSVTVSWHHGTLVRQLSSVLRLARILLWVTSPWRQTNKPRKVLSYLQALLHLPIKRNAATRAIEHPDNIFKTPRVNTLATLQCSLRLVSDKDIRALKHIIFNVHRGKIYLCLDFKIYEQRVTFFYQNFRCSA